MAANLRSIVFQAMAVVGVILFAVLIGMNMRVTPTSSESKTELIAAQNDPPGTTPNGMVWIPGGPYFRGRNDGAEDERPQRLISVTGFWMDATEVTNAQFSEFVNATGYKTIAERPTKLRDYDSRADEKAEVPPFSAVFIELDRDVPLWGPWGDLPHPPWWQAVEGADWRHPEGPGSSLTGRENHPVVHIAWDDAAAYAKWAGKRLPTEAEWECAARGGLAKQEFCWGADKVDAGGSYRANVWQGTFPRKNSAADGYARTSPVKTYPPNGYGLYDMSGNVWEWCLDWYDPMYYREAPSNNPPGPKSGLERVRRGGSFLCCDEYCRRYLPSARDKNPPDSGASHTGFRCVLDPK